MPIAAANGLTLAYEVRGDPAATPLVLVMGLGMPLVSWPDAFVDGLVARGFYVVCFDNRDCGHSEKVARSPLPNLPLAIGRAMLRLKVRAPYSLGDMAKDVTGLLDALGIARAHVVGVSMGGMIAQVMAARFPDRVMSVTSIMASSGNPRVSLGKPEALGAILRRPKAHDPDALVAHFVRVLGVIGSPGFGTDPRLLRGMCERVALRGYYPAGTARQLLAILASGDRRAELARIRASTLVIHGTQDPLLPVAAGRDTARHIPGARLIEIEGMGHDLPPALTPRLVEAIANHCRATEVPASTATAIRPAATLILLRDTAQGLELFMQRRTPGAAFLGGAYVFPGGALDAADADARILERIVGLTDAEANELLALPSGARAYWVAAARECYEESGILLAQDESGAAVTADRIAAVAADRDALNSGALSFADLLARHGLMLPAREIVYYDHWITPPIRPRRFDTRFFVARAPHEQEGSHDNAETVHSMWLRPADALERAERGEIEIAFATGFVLRDFGRFATVDEALADARAKGSIETNRPAVAQGSAGPQIFRRTDAPYAEIHWSDPGETTQTTYDLIPGVPKTLDRFVTRIIAPNPGKMTGPGTNTYLVGDVEVAVIDPGPLIDSHVAAVISCGGDRIRWILCTHTHRDHSPAARVLQAATGARLIGRPAPAGAKQDETFVPDWLPAHDEPLRIAGLTLRALHTPGHASNHCCYQLEETRMLFTGDHVMQGSTVIINPPDGDMRTYLQSLDALLARDIAIIAPGHGYLIGKPHAEIRRLIRHRLWREARVMEALGRRDGATCDELVAEVYADAPLRLHAAAARSLLAHLVKLVADGRVAESGGRYFSVPS